MLSIPITRSIDKELRYYGFKALGLLFGLVLLIVIWSGLGMIFGIMGGVVGYIAGDNISRYWQKGAIQRWCYWNLPTMKIIRSRGFPKSCERRFI